jgi:uncharacterized membrane protein
MIKIKIPWGRLIDRFFEVGVLAKAFFGIFEILGGVTFLASGPKTISQFLIWLAQQEITEDSQDFIANGLIKIATNISPSAHVFATFYLLFHGVVNIFLAVALLKNKLWAYPAALGLFGIFIIYQVYRFFQTFSLLVLVLIIFDFAVVLFVWLEYDKKIKSKLKLKN